MKLDFEIQQKLRLSQTLTPLQLQKLKVLTMNSQELLLFLEEEQLENPILELNSPSAAGDEYVALGEWFRNTDYTNRDDWNATNEDGYFQEIPAKTEISLSDYLQSQIQHRKIPKDLLLLVEKLLPYIDETTAYFSESREYFRTVLHCSESKLEEAISLIREMDPPGIGAFNLADCLKLQLQRRNEYDKTIGQILENHLENLASGNLSRITRDLHISTAKVKHYLRIIRTLNPRPAAIFGKAEPEYVIPDIKASKENGRWEISIRDNGKDRIHLNSMYIQLAKTANDPELENYFKEKINRATNIIHAIEQRESTIRSVAGFALTHQEDFALGKSPKQPLTMRHAAEVLGLHPSTVSRAVQGKYIELPSCVCAFRDLFPIAEDKPTGDAKAIETEQEQIISLIEELIEHEDKRHPLSDQKISDILSQKGISIARRTVSKYREIAGIAKATDRKR